MRRQLAETYHNAADCGLDEVFFVCGGATGAEIESTDGHNYCDATLPDATRKPCPVRHDGWNMHINGLNGGSGSRSGYCCGCKGCLGLTLQRLPIDQRRLPYADPPSNRVPLPRVCETFVRERRFPVLDCSYPSNQNRCDSSYVIHGCTVRNLVN